MHYPRIGITMYGRNDAGEFPIPANYVEAVLRADGLPLVIPPGDLNLDATYASVDALVFAGGGDIDPARYGGESHDAIYKIDHDRDELELSLAGKALDEGMPILAICRGVQVITVALGGTLHAHVPDRFGEDVTHRAPPLDPIPHPIRIAQDSRVAAVLGATACEPMSWHHQAVDRLPDSFRPVAWAPDDVVEAIESPDYPNLLALQWHPEVTAHKDPQQQRVFDWVVAQARSGK